MKVKIWDILRPFNRFGILTILINLHLLHEAVTIVYESNCFSLFFHNFFMSIITHSVLTHVQGLIKGGIGKFHSRIHINDFYTFLIDFTAIFIKSIDPSKEDCLYISLINCQSIIRNISHRLKNPLKRGGMIRSSICMAFKITK